MRDWLEFLEFRTVAAVAAIVVISSSARAGEDRWAWGYCAPPYPPSCVGKQLNGEAHKSCEQSVEVYKASVFTYRNCLVSEMQRAVLETNNVLNALKCSKDKRLCDNQGPDPGAQLRNKAVRSSGPPRKDFTPDQTGQAR